MIDEDDDGADVDVDADTADSDSDADSDTNAGADSDSSAQSDPSVAVGDGRRKYIEVETTDGERHEHGDAYLRQAEEVYFVSSSASFDDEETVAYRKDELRRVTVEQHHSSCFITTAVAGEERTLADLRRFRDEALCPSLVGRPLVTLYERLSPPIADTIADRPDSVTSRVVRSLVRRCATLARWRETASPPVRVGLSILLVVLYVVGVTLAAGGHLAAVVRAGSSAD